MVNLNDDDAVHREAMERHRQVMYEYDRHRLHEASVNRARQGGQLIYRPRGPHSFLLDLARRAFYGAVDQEREGRLRDHSSQLQFHRSYDELRGLDESVSDGSSFAPPAYIQSEFQSGAHPLRATADVCRRLQIPEKASQIIVPAFTSGTSAAVDSTQSQTLGETDPVDTTISCPTTTIAGRVTVSRQWISRRQTLESMMSFRLILVLLMGRSWIRLC
jgi:hypothetical protein